jgi:hypothetical protein
MTTTDTKYTNLDIGCYFDGVRGVYIGEAVQEMAQSHGWKYSAQWEMVYINDVGQGRGDDSLAYHEATDEAEAYLNTLTDDDVAFGPSEQGDWGLWHLCEDEMDCTFCKNA